VYLTSYIGDNCWKAVDPGVTPRRRRRKVPAPEHVPRMVPNIPPQDNPGDMSAPRALVQGLDIMPQPIPHENAQVPCTIGNGPGQAQMRASALQVQGCSSRRAICSGRGRFYGHVATSFDYAALPASGQSVRALTCRLFCLYKTYIDADQNQRGHLFCHLKLYRTKHQRSSRNIG
jgi:hypothetical protein